ncbi:MAG: UDP-galactopyranose mutase [Candidatus Izemoplasmatales bacterium]|nr:UDP-galactopyranose mutase [Candidatus Izemoplasmatales bacterium]
MKKYDYLIVGAGLYGACFAREMTDKNKKCLVIDKRNHIAGNAYTKRINNIDIHVYGAHIFHTSDKEVWDYVKKFGEFNSFVNSPMAIYNDEIYNLPFNMNTFSKMWNIKTPQEAKEIIKKQITESAITTPKNLEEQAISMVGKDIYEKLINGYTKKQWNKDPKDLPASIIKRLPVRYTYDNNYFNDLYQGIPINGYTSIIEKMLDGIEVQLDTDFFDNKDKYLNIAEKVVYTGPIDKFFDYSEGELEYRSLKFENIELETDNFQGNAVINYTDSLTPYTRIIEHKFFNNMNQPTTIISKEYPANYNETKEPYYPINDDKNNSVYEKYYKLSKSYPNIIFGGRLAEYKYYDMHHVIRKALDRAKMEK